MTVARSRGPRAPRKCRKAELSGIDLHRMPRSRPTDECLFCLQDQNDALIEIVDKLMNALQAARDVIHEDVLSDELELAGFFVQDMKEREAAAESETAKAEALRCVPQEGHGE